MAKKIKQSQKLLITLCMQGLILFFFSSQTIAKTIKITLLSNSSGKPSFRVIRLRDNKVLREIYPDESFFIDKSHGQLLTTYVIRKCRGGVDIMYTVKNPTTSSQLLPWFQVQGLRFSPDADNLSTLDMRPTVGNLRKRSSKEKTYNDNKYFPLLKYPGVAFSPVMAISDKMFAMGASLCYPALEYSQCVTMNIYQESSVSKKGSWRISFDGMLAIGSSKMQSIPADKTYKYTLALRFSSPRNWLHTLYPYKKYFRKLYPLSSSKKDLRPIKGYVLADSPAKSICRENPRGYRKYSRIDKNGLDGFVSKIIKECKRFGYKRTMLWTVAGCYNELGRNMKRHAVNYPPQFISNLRPKVEHSISALKKIPKNGITLGLWWGRSGQCPPLPAKWDPKSLNGFDCNDRNQLKFMWHELRTAIKYGANEIGLDAFGTNWQKDRMKWIDKMRQVGPRIHFAAEGGWTSQDYIFSKIAIFCFPSFKLTGPNVWAHYLHPNGEIQIYLTSATFEYLQDLVNWGYTPVLSDYIPQEIVDIRKLKIPAK